MRKKNIIRLKKENLENITNSRPYGLEFANFFLDSLFFPHTRTIFFSQYVRTITVTKYHFFMKNVPTYRESHKYLDDFSKMGVASK